jgi:hypothetical protein
MFCPQCGQQQVSGEMRFCSRCGFPLGGVIQLLASGGMVATSDATAATSIRPLSPRRKGYRQGGLMMLISLIVTPLMAILTEAGLPELLIPLAFMIFFWGGALRMMYARFFEDAGVPAPPAALPVYVPPAGPAQFVAGAPQTALPPQRSTPASGWRQPTNTAEMMPPPSVTENTTRLLDDRDEPPKR